MNPYNYITNPKNTQTLNIASSKGRDILESYATFAQPNMDFNFRRDHYVFGYGSLILSESRSQTFSKGSYTPVLLKGYERSWSFHTEYNNKHKYSALGVIESPDLSKLVNGVLLKINPNEFIQLDQREGEYERDIIDHSKLIGYGINTQELLDVLPNAIIWIYVTPVRRHITPIYPIIQSYVDITLLGCYRISPEFACMFIKTTSGWDHPKFKNLSWKNDRACPIRFEYKLKMGEQLRIDELLSEFIPIPFRKRYLIKQ
jgi:hypothetical protein